MTDDERHRATPIQKSYSRREFLKMAGLAGATVGIGAGLGGLAAGCGTQAITTTSAAANSTVPSAPQTSGSATTVASSAVVTAAAEGGRAIKIGVVQPQTGALASHGIGAEWGVNRAKKVLKDGVVCGDGRLRQFVFEKQDTQSDSNRAAQVTADLIHNSKVDMVVSGGAPDTTSPSADTCEALGCPSLNNAGPWQAFWYERKPPAEGFKWTYGNMIGSEQSVACFIDMFSQVANNKKVGLLVKNDAEGMAWVGEKAAPAVFKALGYSLVMPSLYTAGSDDFTQQISAFKEAGCEIVCGTNNPGDFTNFWKQAVQQGFRPKLVSTGNALLFPQTLDAIGDSGVGLIGEIGWHRDFPFKDSLTGATCAEVADDFESVMDMQYGSGSPSAYHLIEWAIDVFKRAKDPEDKESVIEAVRTTNTVIGAGPIDFTSAVDQNPMDPGSHHPCINCCKQPFAGGQWVKATGKWRYENLICSVATAPGCEVQAKVQPMAY